MSLALAPLDVSVELEANLPCRKFDPDLWFSDSPAELELAKSLCGDCPLRVECLAGAVERAEPWGVWGGEIFERGAVVPRKRPRGRPRKEDVARDAVLRVEVEARLAAAVSRARSRSGWRPDMTRITRPPPAGKPLPTQSEDTMRTPSATCILIHEALVPSANASASDRPTL